MPLAGTATRLQNRPMTDAHQLTVLLHVAAGSLALGVGIVPIVTRKGAPAHRRAGWWFIALGAVVVACADLSCIAWPQPGPLVVATVAATYQYVGGLRSMRRFGSAPGRLDAAMSLGALATCVVLAFRMGPGEASWTPAVGWPVLGTVAAIALYDLSRHWWADAWRRHVRPIDHGLKMTGVFLAMLGAALGSLLPHWKPWSSLAPAVMAPILDGVLIALYVHAHRRRAHRKAEGYVGPYVPA